MRTSTRQFINLWASVSNAEFYEIEPALVGAISKIAGMP
jgi:hypothetical protein